MRVLIAGYGNTGRAIDALIKISQRTVVSSIHLCDEKIHGIKAEHWLIERHDQIDVVINLTGEPPWELLALCQRYHLDYIDTAIDLPENDQRTVEICYQELRSICHDIKVLVGFGMNPGLIEYIYYMSSPTYDHVAIELEYDTAYLEEKKIFNTWSPEAYFKEAILYPPYYYKRGEIHRFLRPPAIQIEAQLNIHEIRRTFDLIPHSEVVSMGKSNLYCESCAFFYQPPLAIQQFLKANKNIVDLQKMQSVSSPGDGIKGDDTVGILIHNNSPRLGYKYNRASHSECSHNFKDSENRGVNGTCWQVACGIYVALELLPFLSYGAYNMTDVANQFSSRIETVLTDLNFEIEQREFQADELYWENIENILRFPTL